MRFKDKVAIVTGGASGIGRATALGIAREGGAAVIADLDLDRARDVAGEAGSPAVAVEADVSVEGDARRITDVALSEFGRVDILVNNAAMFMFKSLEATAEEWERVLGVNVVGQSLCAKYAVEPMKSQGGGSIVNLASMSSFIAQPNMLTYNTTKAAILGLTRCMAVDLAGFGIRVNAVAPGLTETGVVSRALDQMDLNREGFEKTLGPEYLLRRMATADEIAKAILFLASQEASYITGTCLVADGGVTAM